MRSRVRLSRRGKSQLRRLYKRKIGFQVWLYLVSLDQGELDDPFEPDDDAVTSGERKRPHEEAAVDVDEIDGSCWQLQFNRERGKEEIVLLQIVELPGRQPRPGLLRRLLGG